MTFIIGEIPFPPQHGVCGMCGWTGPERADVRDAQQDAVWHVYDEHRHEWMRVVGNRPPERPRPAEPQVSEEFKASLEQFMKDNHETLRRLAD